LVRTHAIRTANEIRNWSKPLETAIQKLTEDADALVQRCAAEALGVHPSGAHTGFLLTLLNRAPKEDDHLVHAARIALREQLRPLTPADSAALESLHREDLNRFVMDAFLGVPGEPAALLCLHLFETKNLIPNAVFKKHLVHLSKHLSPSHLPSLAHLAVNRLSTEEPSAEQLGALRELSAGIQTRSPAALESLSAWAKSLVPSLLAAGGDSAGTAAEICGNLRLQEALPGIRSLLSDPKHSAEVRAKAAAAVIQLDPEPIPALRPFLRDAGVPGVVREKIATAFGEIGSREAGDALADCFKGASHAFQRTLATALNASPHGAELLLHACEAGSAAPALLLEKRISEKLLAHKLPGLTARWEAITRDLPPLNAVLDKLIADRRKTFDPLKANLHRGEEIFAQHCATCHALQGKGGQIGPQLDGVGGRGASRLFEDILDPNRNVDRAFRISMVTQKDGSIVSGMLRRDEADHIALVDLSGQEIRVKTSSVAARKETETSLMPPIFGDLLPEADLHHLISYLLSKTATR
jgi:putative heme-binding domain-containing protein